MIATLKITISKWQHCKFDNWRWLFVLFCCEHNELRIQLNFVNTDSDNTDSQFTRTNFFGPTRSPWFYMQLLMDNTDSANADFRLMQTTFLTRCHQNTSVNTDCVVVWTTELRPIRRQLFTDGSYYNYAGRSNGTSGCPAGEVRCRLTSLCLQPVHANPMRREVAVTVGRQQWIILPADSFWIAGLRIYLYVMYSGVKWAASANRQR